MPCLPHQLLLRCLALVTVLLVASCEREAPEPAIPDLPVVQPIEPLTAIDPLQQAATQAIWARGQTLLERVLSSHADLHQALQALLEAPSDQTLIGAQNAWRRCHEDWHRLDPLLALADSNPGMFARLQDAVFNIDAYPLLPGYIDAVAAYPYSGIVNDISLSINARTLRAQHGLTDSGEVALGFHAMEFLLWGEHGQRQADDFTLIQEATAEQRDAGLNIADLPNNRRRDMLLLLSHLLKDDISNLHTHWQKAEGWLHGIYHQLHPAVRAQLWKNAALHYLEHALDHVNNLDSDPEHSAFAQHNLAPVAAGLQELNLLLAEEETSLPWFAEKAFEEQGLAALSSSITRLEGAAETPLPSHKREQLMADLNVLKQQLKTEYAQQL